MKLPVISSEKEPYLIYRQRGCTVTEEQIEALLRIAHDGIYWFAMALKRSRPTTYWEV